MSRYEVIHDDKGLAFGTDHACGDFLMIWRRPIDSEDRQNQDSFGPEPGDLLFDKDVYLTQLTREEYLEALKEHGFTESELEEAYERLQYP